MVRKPRLRPRRRKPYGRAVAVAVAVSLAAGLAACGEAGQAGGGSDGGSFTIGLLLPDVQATRYKTFDRPLIERKVEELCPECRVRYANARDDVATQQQQVNSMITQGVEVLLLDVVNAASMRPSVEEARRAGIPVVAYDRIADGPVSAVVTYDQVKIGRAQSQAVIRALGERADDAQVVMLDTSPAVIRETALRTKGSLDALKGQVRDVGTYIIRSPGAAGAYDSMSAALADLGAGNIDGVVASNDIAASGAVSALRAARVDPLPPITGQDAELAALQRIVRGDQYMTIYKPFRPEAEAAAEIAVALGRGEELGAKAEDRISSSTTKDIPAVLLDPVPVMAGNIKTTVVKDGMFSLGEICTARLAAVCERAGLTR